MSTETIPEIPALEESIVTKLRQLSPDRQQQVLDFVEFMHQRTLPKQPGRSVKGIGKHLVDKPITVEEIDEARREMWGEYMNEESAA